MTQVVRVGPFLAGCNLSAIYTSSISIHCKLILSSWTRTSSSHQVLKGKSYSISRKSMIKWSELCLHVWRRNADIFCTNRLQSNLFCCCFLSNRWQNHLSSTLDNILESLLSINSDGSRGMVMIHNCPRLTQNKVIKSKFTECHWFRIFSFKNSETYTYNHSKKKKTGYCAPPKNLLKCFYFPCSWFMLKFGRNQQNSVKQLSFNLQYK